MNGLRVIADEPVSRQLRQDWRDGVLRQQWLTEHPDLFCEHNVVAKQPEKWFSEWHAAIILKQTRGMLSLLTPYGYYGLNDKLKKHARKHEILPRCLTEEQYKWLVAKDRKLPDLFVYRPDFSDPFFCEVKGPGDRIRPEQLVAFAELQAATGLEIVQFNFHWIAED